MTGSIWDDIKFRVIHSRNSLIHLIAINVVLFLITAIPIGITALWGVDVYNKNHDLLADWAYLPADLNRLLYRPWTLVTHFFMHSFSPFHILFNMLWFWWFGSIYHDLMGNRRTVELYIFAGLAGGIAFVVGCHIFPALSINSTLVGASGAVTGFIVAAATLTPHRIIRLLFFGDLKIWYIAAFSIIMDLLFLADNTGGRIAHLAGGLSGYVFVTQLKKGRDLGSWISYVLAFFQNLFWPSASKSNFKVHQSKTSAKAGPQSSRASFSHASQAEIDAILDKISKSGYDSLSPKEREILFRASDKKE